MDRLDWTDWLGWDGKIWDMKDTIICIHTDDFFSRFVDLMSD